jgi:hypothetical protein
MAAFFTAGGAAKEEEEEEEERGERCFFSFDVMQQPCGRTMCEAA